MSDQGKTVFKIPNWDHAYSFDLPAGRVVVKGPKLDDQQRFKLKIPLGMFDDTVRLRFYPPVDAPTSPDNDIDNACSNAGQMYEVRQMWGTSPRPGSKFRVFLPTGPQDSVQWEYLFAFQSADGEDEDDWKVASGKDRKVKEKGDIHRIGGKFADFGALCVFERTPIKGAGGGTDSPAQNG